MNQSELNNQLIRAIIDGKLDITKQLIDHGADINNVYEDGETPLIWSIKYKHPDITEYLIEHGADINVTTKNGWTPLMYASIDKIFKLVVEYLVEHGANIHATDNEGWTPLMFAALNRNLDTVKYLVEHGADVNHVNNDGETALLLAIRMARNLDTVKYLTEHGANIEVQDNGGNTPLTEAINYVRMNVIEYLVEQGVNVNTDIHGISPLWRATGTNLQIVKYLTEHGADTSRIDLRDVFHTANENVIRYLLKHGANWSNFDGYSAFREVLREETKELKQNLVRNYITLEKSTPQKITADGKVKSLLPKNLLLKTVYEVPYQQYCSSVKGKIPPIQLIALANILKLDYDLDISWIDLCDKVKHILYLLL